MAPYNLPLLGGIWLRQPLWRLHLPHGSWPQQPQTISWFCGSRVSCLCSTHMLISYIFCLFSTHMLICFQNFSLPGSFSLSSHPSHLGTGVPLSGNAPSVTNPFTCPPHAFQEHLYEPPSRGLPRTVQEALEDISLLIYL